MNSNQDVIFEPFPKQLEFLEAVFSQKYSFVLYGGSIRGGKTYALLALFILLSKMYPGSRWAIVRKDLPTIKKNLFPSWEKIKPTNFIKHENNSEHVVTFNNGSQLIFFPECFDIDKELNRWKGFEVNGFGFEEINECQEMSLGKAFERAGSYIIKGAERQPPPIVVGTANPSFGWVKDKIFKPWQSGTLNPRWLYIQSKIYDNIPLLTQQPLYLQSLKDNMNRFEYEVFVEGNWDINLKTGGEFYKCFEIDKHVQSVFYDEKLPLHISFDDNVNPYLPVGVYQIKGNELRLIDEITGISPNNTVERVCQEFERRYFSHNAGLFIYGDATANKEDTKIEKGMNFYSLVMNNLKKYHPTNRVIQSNPSVAMRGKWINTMLEKDTVKVVISETCKHTINDMLMVKEKADGGKLKEEKTDPKTKVRYQCVGHFSDILDYIMVSAFKNEYTEYQRGGKISNPINVPNYSKNSW